MAGNSRMNKIDEELRKEISSIISTELKNPHLTGLISVTKVKVTNDLKYAKIYVSILNSKNIKEILEVDDAKGKQLIAELNAEYKLKTRGIKLELLGGAFKLTTKKEHKEYYQKLIENKESNTLSQAALETLAIIAYNEPITRIQVDEIRGVSSSQVIRKLVAKNLIKEIGRSDIVGRPILYKTTSDFLDYFGLATIEDLPKIESLKIGEKNEEFKDLYHSKYNEKETE